jgi:hypothetical protein
MDNCVKNNKNRHLLVFLSLLTARDVFEEVKLGFLVVGHTHKDINGCFGYLSKKLEGRKQLRFNRFDESFHDLIGKTVHSSIDLGDSRF